MADADEATNALIARILAGDAEQNHYNEHSDGLGDGECSNDSDFEEPAAKRPRSRRVRSIRGTGLTSTRSNASSGSANDFTETGRRRRKDQGAKRETVSKGWSDQEEALFLEALELHGRLWAQGAAHVGTRDKKQFCSHAQKHFIRLCIADRALPERVVQTGQGSGLGYTLSGHLLDPESASAHAYGLRPEHVKRLMKSKGPGLQGLLLPEKVISEESNKETAADKRLSEQEVQPSEPTEYSKQRPKREGAGMRSAVGDTSESQELVPCKEFIGPPGSGTALAQPFEVNVDPQVTVVMDFHAHLCTCEIIGLLGGTWDAQARHLHVKAAYPCERLEGSHSCTSVEIDPGSQIAAQEMMQSAGHTSVGWYHSHPIFAAIPSVKDNENQRNQQALHRCSETSLEPCIGAIVSPYDPCLPTEASAISWFVVQSKANQVVPYRIRLKETGCAPLDACKVMPTLKKLAESTAKDSAQVNLNKIWIPRQSQVEGSDGVSKMTYLNKLRFALVHHLKTENWDMDNILDFLKQLEDHLRTAWRITSEEAFAEPIAKLTVKQIQGDKS